ncbi:MAG TPA: S1 RNA-binding domain-containing protein, partial [Zoogloea sp.]|uniref:S1 RNA-binding domain-containing protein n=1 Tax=Zoogloea sp. TaxID=49181 RepID=UPI002CA1CC7E
QHEGLPEGLALGDLLRLGAQWLAGREDRAEWTYVWQALLAQHEGLPEGLALGDLLRLGAQWLTGREDRAAWAHIWQDLLAQHEGLPEGLALGDLLRLGAQWLTGREDRAAWAHIWQDLLAQHEGLPEGLALGDLLRLGAQWLAGREDRAEWTYVWQALLAQHEGLPEGLALGDLLRLGAQWLTGREDRAAWAHIWQDLLAQHEGLPEGLALGDLLRLGAQWLAGRESSEEWGFVCEALLDQQFQAVTFIEHAAAWLKRTGAKPEWPLLAAKFIIAAPLHAASVEFARALTARIKACANNAHWFKTANLVGALPTHIELPSEVRDWLQTLHARTELPAWAEVRHCRNEGLPVKGRVIAVHDKTTTVELDIGLVAVWPSDRDGIRRKKGLERSFFVRQLVPDKGRVIVCTEKPVTLEVNQIYQGSVVKHLEFGLLVNIVGQTGLLHQSHYPDWANLVRAFPVGSQITVEILAFNDKGPELRYADSKPTSNRGLAVGDIYDACVTGLKDYGVFLRIGAYSGLLHISQLPPDTDIPKRYLLGQKLAVQVIQIRDDGKISFALPASAA